MAWESAGACSGPISFADQLGQQLGEEAHDPRPSNQPHTHTERRQNRRQEVLDVGLGTLARLEVIELLNESVAGIIEIGEDGNRGGRWNRSAVGPLPG